MVLKTLAIERLTVALLLEAGSVVEEGASVVVVVPVKGRAMVGTARVADADGDEDEDEVTTSVKEAASVEVELLAGSVVENEEEDAPGRRPSTRLWRGPLALDEVEASVLLELELEVGLPTLDDDDSDDALLLLLEASVEELSPPRERVGTPRPAGVVEVASSVVDEEAAGVVVG